VRSPALGRVATHVVLWGFTLAALMPVYVMLSAALRTQDSFLNHPFAFPLSPTFANYRTALDDRFPRWLLNSLILSGGSVVVTLILAAFAAWGFSRYRFRGRDTVLNLIVALMVVPPVVLVVPLFLLGVELNLINTFRLVIVIYVGLMLPFSIYMLTAYFRTIPAALLDAAIIDGASELQVFRRVVLPLSMAPILTLLVVNLLWVWNELLIALVFLQSDDSRTLMAGLTAFQNRYNLDIPVVMAGLSLATLPILLLYLFGQRYFMRGLVAGAIKGE
jgi:ABC-type glycerol-3-phosphate transport system permease component